MSGDDRDRLINVNVAIALARRHNTGERAAALVAALTTTTLIRRSSWLRRL